MKRLLRLLLVTTGIMVASLFLVIGSAAGAPLGHEVSIDEEEEEEVIEDESGPDRRGPNAGRSTAPEGAADAPADEETDAGEDTPEDAADAPEDQETVTGGSASPEGAAGVPAGQETVAGGSAAPEDAADAPEDQETVTGGSASPEGAAGVPAGQETVAGGSAAPEGAASVPAGQETVAGGSTAFDNGAGAAVGQEATGEEEEEEDVVEEDAKPEKGVIVMLSGERMTLDIKGLLTTFVLGEDAECALVVKGMDEVSFPCNLLQVGATVSVASEETEEGALKAVAIAIQLAEEEEEVEGSPVVAILGGEYDTYGMALSVENEAEAYVQMNESVECFVVRNGTDDASMPCSDLQPGQVVEVEAEENEEGVLMATAVYVREG
ncbi:MAG: hypothetical protein HY681_12715 [Chloroflexi bacterium]|nr:hypothetical protein [Chloroflexota bacterium]